LSQPNHFGQPLFLPQKFQIPINPLYFLNFFIRFFTQQIFNDSFQPSLSEKDQSVWIGLFLRLGIWRAIRKAALSDVPVARR
jgi:hypothetical protein